MLPIFPALCSCACSGIVLLSLLPIYIIQSVPRASSFYLESVHHCRLSNVLETKFLTSKKTKYSKPALIVREANVFWTSCCDGCIAHIPYLANRVFLPVAHEQWLMSRQSPTKGVVEIIRLWHNLVTMICICFVQRASLTFSFLGASTDGCILLRLMQIC